ncbi:MAG: protein kinase [Actinomycetota bacterium]|jgi:serine/threonine protein kinase
MIDVLRQGRYRVERPLGTGAMGTVVLARDTVLERPVAIKVLAGHLADDDAFRERFLREARLAARLCHPNIVQVFDAGDDGTPFLVMEYVDGETVAERLARGERFSAGEVATLAGSLSSALAQAHALGIVHRDVKPHNVLLTRKGVAKLTDFGIARALKDQGLTEIGTVLGTAPFMAPEQAAGEPVGPAADVFGLGAVLRYAAGGPLPPALQALVDAASAPDPSARPTAAELHDRLAALAADDAPTQLAVPPPTQIAPVELPDTAAQRRPQRRSPLPLLALGTLVTLILLLALLPRGGANNDDASSSVPPVPQAANPTQAARDLATWFRDQAD